MTDRYAVMGHPVSHSLSPAIHTAFARQIGAELEYTAIHVEPGQLAEAVRRFREVGGAGLNITVPHKEDAYELAEVVSARGRRAGALNTLWFDDGERLNGENTDGIGLVRDLVQNHGCRLEGRRIALLGAGGASRGVLGPLLEQLPDALVIANRTASKAVDLAEAFAEEGPVSACGLDDLADGRFDVVINATSASLGGKVPALPEGLFAEDAWCYDMMYAAEPTAFLRWAGEHGAAHLVDGIGMLVEQAAESFRIWRGVRPDTGPVINELRRRAL